MLRVTRQFLCAAATNGAASSCTGSASAAAAHKFQVAIVGSGPGGCYAAHHLLKQRSDVHVDIFDRVPVPFGLSRYGVAPDHPEVKNVEKTFTTLLEERRKDVTLMTNVTVGAKGIPLSLLQEHYAAVVLAHGAASERKLHIPGEGLGNVLSAKRFVEYYNTVPTPYGNPIVSPLELDKMRRVVIIGNGNVALDVARALAAPYRHFCPTDMNCFAVRELMNSTVEEVVIVGRRGHEHSAFTTKEFREIATISNTCKVEVEPFDLKAAVERSRDVRAKKRQLELMHKYTPGGEADREAKVATGTNNHGNKPPVYSYRSEEERQAAFSIFQAEHHRDTKVKSEDIRRRVYFAYNLSPAAFHPDGKNPNRVGAVEFVSTHDTTRKMIIPCDAVLTSIGYKSEPITGAAFDESTSTLPNYRGKVLPGKRLYAAGWAKTGPQGVILSTMNASQETAATISAEFDEALKRKAEDEANRAKLGGMAVADEALENGPLGATNEGKYGLIDAMVQLKMEPLSYAQVKKIWFAERQRGVDLGKAGEKVQSVQDMLDIAGEDRKMARRAKDRFLGNAAARPRGLELMEDWLDPDTEIIDLSDPKRTNPEMNVRL
jgi:adrenodoxin-NADP+ reductase